MDREKETDRLFGESTVQSTQQLYEFVRHGTPEAQYNLGRRLLSQGIELCRAAAEKGHEAAQELVDACADLPLTDAHNYIAHVNRTTYSPEIEGAMLVREGLCPGDGVSSMQWRFYDNGVLLFEEVFDTAKAYSVLPAKQLNYLDTDFWEANQVTGVVLLSPISALGDRAFHGGAEIRNVHLPNSLKTIGDSAFFNCVSLKTVDIPRRVNSIGPHAFSGCSSLQELKLPNVRTVRDGLFYGCTALRHVVFPERGCKTIGAEAFFGCQALSSLVLPYGTQSVELIKQCAFCSCMELKSLYLPISLKRIAKDAFFACKSLTDVYYEGTQAQWAQIQIEGQGNQNLLDAQKHFSRTSPQS